MPRPARVFSEAEIQQVEQLAALLTAEQIAHVFGIGERTFLEVRTRQPEVSAAYKKGRAQVAEKIARSLVKRALDGDLVAQMFYLKTQCGWRETTKIDAHVTNDATAYLDVDKLSDDELGQLAGIIERCTTGTDP